MTATATTPNRKPRLFGVNIAILTGIVLVPFVVAAGFLADRLEAPQPVAAPALTMWPELRGTFDPADDTNAAAAPAHRAGPGAS